MSFGTAPVTTPDGSAATHGSVVPHEPAATHGPAATRLIEVLRARRESVATAESLTGGLVCAALTSVPGASAVVRGGVIAYATDVKADVLGVDPELLTTRGAVDPDVALAMAHGVCRRLSASWGIATTGVAGPDPADGKPVGCVFVAVAGPEHAEVRELSLVGDRASVRALAVEAALSLAGDLIGRSAARPAHGQGSEAGVTGVP